LVTSLHEKHHKITLKYSEMKDNLEVLEARNDELKLRIDDLEFELSRTRSREVRLQKHLYETNERLKELQLTSAENETGKGPNAAASAIVKQGSENMSSAKFEDLSQELEEYKELANKRLTELEQLNNQHKDTLNLVEKLKMDLQCLPESVVIETVEYKCLQSHFSVLYNESMQLKTQLEDTRGMMQNAKNAHLRQIEHMESEELSMQKRLRTETIQLEDQLAQVRKEYEMLRLEFEQSLAATEQTGPINKEMRHLITSLQNHNQQLKGEVMRYKRRLKDMNHECAKLKHQLEQQQQQQNLSQSVSNIKQEIKQEHQLETSSPENVKRQRTDSGSSIKLKEASKESEDKKPDINALDSLSSSKETSSESGNTSQSNSSSTIVSTFQSHSQTFTYHHRSNHHIKKEDGSEMSTSNFPISSGSSSHERIESKTKLDSEMIIRDLKNQCKKYSEQCKEMKLVLDMYKSVPKEQRDKVMLMSSERKCRLEIEELKKQLVKYQEESRRDRKRLVDEDAAREIAKLKETIGTLQKSLASQKQEDEALLNEMEVTGSAFEDMQEQNLRLIQQLREKDDANFKLMSERIKSQQIQKLLKEEKESLTEQVIALNAQVEAQNQVVRKLEEKERLLQNNLSTIEKELGFKQQAMELHRRKAIEFGQSAADLKLHLDKYSAQLKEAQASVADKTSNLQQEAFKNQRLQEELLSWKRQYERAKKFELATTADEVLQEEIREYKAQLTCPSCKTNRKDAVLTKCFHVFCFDCLKTRYETRQRKCPKCNALFGANDFHRLYLA